MLIIGPQNKNPIRADMEQINAISGVSAVSSMESKSFIGRMLRSVITKPNDGKKSFFS